MGLLPTCAETASLAIRGEISVSKPGTSVKYGIFARLQESAVDSCRARFLNHQFCIQFLSESVSVVIAEVIWFISTSTCLYSTSTDQSSPGLTSGFREVFQRKLLHGSYQYSIIFLRTHRFEHELQHYRNFTYMRRSFLPSLEYAVQFSFSS